MKANKALSHTLKIVFVLSILLLSNTTVFSKEIIPSQDECTRWQRFWGTCEEEPEITPTLQPTLTPLPATQTPEPTPTEISFDQLESLIQSSQPLPAPPLLDPSSTLIGTQLSPPDFRSGTAIACDINENTGSTEAKQFTVYDTNHPLIWPGSLIQGQSINTGNFKAIRGQRAPISITMSNAISDNNTAEIDNANEAKVEAEIRKMLPEEIQPLADVSTQFQYSYIQSQKELELLLAAELGLTLSGSTNIAEKFQSSVGFAKNIEAGAGIDWDNQKQHIVVIFQQPYYSVSAKGPDIPYEWFVNPNYAILEKDINILNPPLYVSSVTYGRLVVAVIESTSASLDIEVAFSEKVGINQEIEQTQAKAETQVQGGSENSIDITGTSGGSNESLRVSVFSHGGPSALPQGYFPDLTLDKLIEYLNTGMEISQNSKGAPLFFTLKYLKDDELVAQPFNTTFGSYRCIEQPIDAIQVNVNLHSVCLLTSDERRPDFELRNFAIHSPYQKDPITIGKNIESRRIQKGANCEHPFDLIAYDSSFKNQSFDINPKDGCFQIKGEIIEDDGRRFRDDVAEVSFDVCFEDGVLVNNGQIQSKDVSTWSEGDRVTEAENIFRLNYSVNIDSTSSP